MFGKKHNFNHRYRTLTIVFLLKDRTRRTSRCGLTSMLFYGLMRKERTRERERRIFSLGNLRSIYQNKLSTRRAEMAVTSLLFSFCPVSEFLPIRIQTTEHTIGDENASVCRTGNNPCLHTNLSRIFYMRNRSQIERIKEEMMYFTEEQIIYMTTTFLLLH